MNLLCKQNAHLAFGLFTLFILTSEGKYPQLDTVSNQLEANYDEGQENDSHNQSFSFKEQRYIETHVGNIVKRNAAPLKIYQALYTDHSAPGTAILAYVDSTMTKLVFQVAVERSNPVIVPMTPSATTVTTPVPTNLQNVTATTPQGLIQTSGLVTIKQLLVTTNPLPLDTNDTSALGALKPKTTLSPLGIQTNLKTATESPLMSSLKPQSVTTTEGIQTGATVFTSAENGINNFNSNTSLAISASISRPVPTSSQDITPTTPPGLIQTSGHVTNTQRFLNTNDNGLLGAQEPKTTFSPQGKQTHLTTASESPLMSSSKPTLETMLTTGAEGNQAVHIGKLEASEKQKLRHASQTMILIKILQGGCAKVDFEDSEEN